MSTVPAQTLDVGWVALAALFFGPGAVAGLLCAPFLLAERLRALFRALPPGEAVVVPYAAAALVGSLPYVAGTLLVLSETADAARGAAASNALFGLIVALSVCYVVGVPLLAGVDWDPTGYGPGTWALLGGLGAAYATVFTLPLVLFALVLALPT
ncbi:MAG: hypothetical protein A07HB70_01453 [uncultured archaeon A07HB70]|nr:MAG: hypothetical protein A07HB70_01453 [uncultured archaeon A07HB70]